ncbi:helix-turn-helix transcriptional regulator [Arthrobacter cupressi]|uniref:helix-turn-helix transcriptional regulator n=1 Tax=Arthrobacter cupressi TaxID=1045773 RepID=UPI001587C50E|nr:helix-turn-helix transcriptional regulator [Arthrobacter cupressi]NYD76744.1 DNA-binding CsgD family transcriptional regulator/HPt (histidine-containing phosphotransfer) domain-containing protein [Arthrobacter cupressi]
MADLDEEPRDRARRLYAAREWAAAANAFSAVDPDQLTSDDLAAYADAAWWLGRIGDCIRLNVEACAAFESASRPVDAAAVALRVGIFHLARGDQSQGDGWLGHAERLLEGSPEGRVHGLLRSLTGLDANLLAGRPAAALEVAGQILDLGRRLEDPVLVAVGVNGEGRALTMSGKVAGGLALLDEVMVTVLQGKFDPFMTGVLYCHTIAACHEVGDVRRMGQWTDLAEEWLTKVPAEAVFSAMCAVHRVQLRLMRGEWDKVESQALSLIPGLDANRLDYAAQAWYLIGEARRLRGQANAAGAYAEAHVRGLDPQPGSALLQLAGGDPGGALAAVHAALAAAGQAPLRRAALCAAMVEIAIAAAQFQAARDAVAELEQTASVYATSGLEAMAASGRGAVLLADGRAVEALPVLRDACTRWYRLGSEYEAAKSCLLLAEAYRSLGDVASAGRESVRAQEIFARLGAGGTERGRPDGLSPRECEVLALVADGCSNREIGTALFISDRTVARHLTNIYNKIGVVSRTQAARYAIAHHLSTAP